MRLRVRRKKANLKERKRMHGRRKWKRKIKRETGIEIGNLRREKEWEEWEEWTHGKEEKIAGEREVAKKK